MKDVIESFDETESKAIPKAKAALHNTAVMQHLAYVKSNLSSLPDLITALEGEGIRLSDSVDKTEQFIEESKFWEGAIGERLRKKLEAVLLRNPGWKTVQQVARILKGEVVPECEFTDPSDIAALKFLPIVSCEVERSFSMLKNVLTDKRRNFKLENLEKTLVILCSNL